MKLKVLVYGLSNEYGGIESFFLNLLDHSSTDVLQLDFVFSAHSASIFEEKIIGEGGQVHYLTSWGKNALKHAKELDSALKKENYDYIWVNATNASNVSVYKVAKQHPETKIILHSHGQDFETKNKGIKARVLQLLHNKNKKKLPSYADLKFASSTKAAEWLFGKEAVSKEEYTVIKNGIPASNYIYDPKVRKSARDRLNLNQSFTILHVGRMEQVKNHLFLIDVFKEVCQKCPDSALLLVGTGSMEETIKRKVNEQGLANKVYFLGYQNEINQFLQAADAFVLPSWKEGLGIVAVEAQASGLPTIVSEGVPKEAEITDLVTFFSLNQPAEKWAENILTSSQGIIRQNQYQAIKAAGFDIEDTVQQVEIVLKKHQKT